MKNYFENLDEIKRQYFEILSPGGFPDWINEYVSSPEMARLAGVGMYCGTEIPKMYNPQVVNSTLDHSVGVALIVWNFTHDKKQALAGLFHDIATPTFKHCIDYMNGDSEKQESTEDKTEEMIAGSKVIRKLLERDGIDLAEVADYHKYPIADNDTPRLSADRLEYTLSNAVFFFDEWDLSDVKLFYDNLTVAKNEDGEDEIAFFDPEIAKEFEFGILPMFATYNSDPNRTIMQFLGDIMKSLAVKGKISVQDMYVLSESDVVDIIENCGDDYITNAFEEFKNADHVWGADAPNPHKYSISAKGKKRFIVPLVTCGKSARRINDIDEDVNEFLEAFHKIKRSKFTGFDFYFEPYEFEKTK